MRIKLISRYAGPGGYFPPGFSGEFKDGEALVKGGYAVSLEEPEKEKEAPEEKPAETPEKKPGRPKKAV